MVKKETHIFRIMLFIIQLVIVGVFIFFMYLDFQVWGADFSLLVSVESGYLTLWESMYDWIFILGLVTLLGFIPTVIINIVGLIRFFTKRKGAAYLVLVIGSTILELFQMILAMCIFGISQ